MGLFSSPLKYPVLINLLASCDIQLAIRPPFAVKKHLFDSLLYHKKVISLDVAEYSVSFTHSAYSLVDEV